MKVKSKVNGGVWKVACGGENWEKIKKYIILLQKYYFNEQNKKIKVGILGVL